MADRVESGWRRMELEDVAREISPAYSEAVDLSENLEKALKKGMFVVNQRQTNIDVAAYRVQERLEAMSGPHRLLHNVG